MFVFFRSWQLLPLNFQMYAGLGVKSSCGVAIPKRTTCWEGHLLPLLRISCDLTAIGSEYDSMTSMGGLRICGMISLPSTRTKELTWRNKSTAITSARCSDCNRHQNTFCHKILTYPNIIWHDLTSFLFSPVVPTHAYGVPKLLRKALRFGGVDIVLRTLALFRADERVGYHGVVSLFTEPLQGRARSMLGSSWLSHVVTLTCAWFRLSLRICSLPLFLVHLSTAFVASSSKAWSKQCCRARLPSIESICPELGCLNQFATLNFCSLIAPPFSSHCIQQYSVRVQAWFLECQLLSKSNLIGQMWHADMKQVCCHLPSTSSSFLLIDVSDTGKKKDLLVLRILHYAARTEFFFAATQLFQTHCSQICHLHRQRSGQLDPSAETRQRWLNFPEGCWWDLNGLNISLVLWFCETRWERTWENFLGNWQIAVISWHMWHVPDCVLSQGLPTPCFWSILDVPKMSKVFHSNSYMGVSKNRGTPKWMVFFLMEKNLFFNGWFGGDFTHYFRKHPYHFDSFPQQHIICCGICQRVEVGSCGSSADPKKASDLPFGDAQHLDLRVHG